MLGPRWWHQTDVDWWITSLSGMSRIWNNTVELVLVVFSRQIVISVVRVVHRQWAPGPLDWNGLGLVVVIQSIVFKEASIYVNTLPLVSIESFWEVELQLFVLVVNFIVDSRSNTLESIIVRRRSLSLLQLSHRHAQFLSSLVLCRWWNSLSEALSIKCSILQAAPIYVKFTLIHDEFELERRTHLCWWMFQLQVFLLSSEFVVLVLFLGLACVLKMIGSGSRSRLVLVVINGTFCSAAIKWAAQVWS